MLGSRSRSGRLALARGALRAGWHLGRVEHDEGTLRATLSRLGVTC